MDVISMDVISMDVISMGNEPWARHWIGRASDLACRRQTHIVVREF